MQGVFASHEINEAEGILSSDQKIFRSLFAFADSNDTGASDRMFALVESVTVPPAVVAKVEASSRHP